ncbi:probable methylglutaconyl-coa hydratase, mitochondrial precursor [Melanopsichium pennsylvanicum]|uniref:Probable methylglutaconyl-coa hydratase, mitochondrial n=2 Tax=Melanopsichium pennsylvanicum TaxID=63383 RepID=A0AAJ4XJ44_9BASI|nr:probable methylglutaconyl-coa hydratase, mitochondrial precursor [Melanopsichium pennsylvanicum 4]SNX82911.1 probable methylglutaconyl-coa hydratase, mitochondrial precursor [Melanopsichium pennsylvanicum]
MLSLRPAFTSTSFSAAFLCRSAVCFSNKALRSYSTAADPSQLVTLAPLSAIAKSELNSTSDYDEHIAVLTLNRASAMNAISRALSSEMDQHVTSLLTSTTVRTLLIRSSVPKAFCAGADLKERKGMTKPEVDAFLYGLRGVFTNVSRLPMPTIACLDGLAMGGGLELALTCDLRIAGPAATKLGLTETKLGIIPGAGGTSRMTRLVGPAKAKEMIFSAKLVDAVEASRIGLVDIVAQEGGENAAFKKGVQLARGFAKNGPLAVRAAKLAIDKGEQMDPETALDFERQCYETILGTKDRLEGLKAFAEKREPVYRGE